VAQVKITRDEIGRMLADANCDYIEATGGPEGRRWDVDLPEKFKDMYRHMADAIIALVYNKVSEGVQAGVAFQLSEGATYPLDEIVARVMGEEGAS
jgi:hypothetical protein